MHGVMQVMRAGGKGGSFRGASHAYTREKKTEAGRVGLRAQGAYRLAEKKTSLAGAGSRDEVTSSGLGLIWG